MFNGTYLKRVEAVANNHENEAILRQYPIKYLDAIVQQYKFYEKNKEYSSSRLFYDPRVKNTHQKFSLKS